MHISFQNTHAVLLGPRQAGEPDTTKAGMHYSRYIRLCRLRYTTFVRSSLVNPIGCSLIQSGANLSQGAHTSRTCAQHGALRNNRAGECWRTATQLCPSLLRRVGSLCSA